MKQVALLDYKFLFDPSECWSSVWEFESDIGKFFDACGLEAQIIKGVDGQAGARVIFLTKKPKITDGAQTEANRKKFIAPAKQVQKLINK